MTPRFNVPDVQTLLQKMVQCPSVNQVVSDDMQAESAMAKLNETFAKQLKCDVQYLPVKGRASNLLIRYQVDASLPWLMFDSHLDTVAAKGMTVDPFAGEIRDGKLWGRGSCDTKGTGAAMLWALKQYQSQPIKPTNIAILFSIDEEFGMTGIRSFIQNDYPKLGFKPVGVIVGEPTMLKPIIAHNGTVRLHITTQGMACHSSDPSKGRSAISMMVKVIDALESTYIPSLTNVHPLTGKSQCSINMIQGGTQINIIPDHCEISIDRRVIPYETLDTISPKIERILKTIRAANPDASITQSTCFQCPPLCPEHAKPLQKKVEQALANLGIDNQSVGVGYATNGGDLGEAGIPTIVIGPGNIAKAHTKDEFIELDQLMRGVDVYQALMQTNWQV